MCYDSLDLEHGKKKTPPARNSAMKWFYPEFPGEICTTWPELLDTDTPEVVPYFYDLRHLHHFLLKFSLIKEASLYNL